MGWKPPAGDSTGRMMGGRSYVSLPSLVPPLASGDAPMIVGRRFHRQVLVGPAILAPLGSCTIRGSRLDAGVGGSIESALFLQPDSDVIVGAIGLLNCEIVECVLHRIGFVGDEDLLEMLRHGFRSADS